MTPCASFGSGAARKKEEWQSLIRQMVADGFLVARRTWRPRHRRAGPTRCAGAKPVPVSREARAAHQGARRAGGNRPKRRSRRCWRRSRRVRLRLARERQVPAYVIFSDRTLIDMAARRPRDLDGFAAVNGVGAAKLKDFGTIFLGAIAAHDVVE